MIHRTILAFLAMTFLSGCLPEIDWLPDSSGFLFSEFGNGQMRIVEYDLATKKRGFLSLSNSGTPALSPDGKRFATIKQADAKKGEKGTLQVLIHDRDGKIVRQSRVFSWEGGMVKGGDLFWHQEEKLLVATGSRVAIYDPVNDQISILKEIEPLRIGNTPIRPDGKGFLAVRRGKIAFIEWTGVEHDIPGTPTAVLEKERVLFTQSRWEGDVAISLWRDGEWRIDTAKKQASFNPKIAKELWQYDGKEILHRYTFPGRKTEVFVLSEIDLSKVNEKLRVSVIRVGPERDRRQILIEEAGYCALFPSPDKSKLAVYIHFDEKEKKEPSILVLDQNAEIVAKIKAGE